MGFSFNNNVLNQKGSPAIYTDIFANRPAAGFQGRLFISTDTAAIYEDTGTAWTLIANVSSGAGTLQQVTTNGNTSNVGISVTAGGVSSNSLTVTSLTTGSVPFVGASGLITQDNPNLFWDDTNNRLGVNTNTPSNTLDVHTSGTTAAIAINNTAGNQALISFLNTSAARWRIGNTAGNFFDIINVFTSTSAISINSAGNVVTLIGALNGTSSVFSSTITSTTNGSTFGNSAIGGNPLIVKANAVSRAIQLLNTLGGAAEILAIGNATSSSIGFNTIGQSDAFVIYNDGSNRSNGDVGMWGATTRNVNFFDATNNNINAQIQYSEVNSNTGQLLFKTNNAGTLATKLTLLEDGKLGIGTLANGSAKLNILNISANPFLELRSTNNVYQIAKITFDEATDLMTITNNQAASTSGIALATNATERLRVTQSGNLLLNSTTDDTVNKLQVTGSASITNNLTIGNGSNFGIILKQNSAVQRFKLFVGNGTSGFTADENYIASLGTGLHFMSGGTASTEIVLFNDNGVVKIVNLAGTGSRAVLADASGNLSAPVSDQSVKENIEPLKYGLETIMKLNAVQFEFIEGYKNYGEGLQIGAIAQEVEEIIPEAVFKTPSTGLKGIDYNQLNGIYIKAIQELNERIELLLSRIEYLENK
jgi:hypothetical protein